LPAARIKINVGMISSDGAHVALLSTADRDGARAETNQPNAASWTRSRRARAFARARDFRWLALITWVELFRDQRQREAPARYRRAAALRPQ
jgi:hypothetical protein